LFRSANPYLHILRYARQSETGKTAGRGHDLGTVGKLELNFGFSEKPIMHF